MKFPKDLALLLKPKLNKKVYDRLTTQVKTLAQKLENIPDGEEYKALYILSELQKTGSEWVDVYEWPREEFVRFAATIPFETGNSNGVPVNKTKENCPQCGLTPLVDQFCNTCNKFVIFRFSKDYPTRLTVTDELILATD